MKKQQVVFDVVSVHNPEAKNIILGQSHFIKTVEDLHEVLVGSVPGIQFGLAFCEASGPRLIRTAGTNQKMIELAVQNAKKVRCGHTFFIFLDNVFPINVLHDIKRVQEVVTLFCATANPVEVIVARTKQGGAVLGVVDGGSPKGVEKESDVKFRKEILRKFGYKL